MRLRQVNMYTPRIRVGQRLKTVLREKQSARLQTVGQQNRAAEVKKTNKQFNMPPRHSLCMHELKFTELQQHWIQSSLHRWDLSPSTKTSTLRQNTKFGTNLATDQKAIASQHLCSSTDVHRLKKRNILVLRSIPHPEAKPHVSPTPTNFILRNTNCHFRLEHIHNGLAIASYVATFFVPTDEKFVNRPRWMLQLIGSCAPVLRFHDFPLRIIPSLLRVFSLHHNADSKVSFIILTSTS